MRKVDHGEKKKKEKKRMPFLVATMSLPAVYRPNGCARTTTAGTPHARAKNKKPVLCVLFIQVYIISCSRVNIVQEYIVCKLWIIRNSNISDNFVLLTSIFKSFNLPLLIVDIIIENNKAMIE